MSEPDAYGYMGVGVGLLSGSGTIVVWEFLNLLGFFYLAFGMAVTGVIMFLAGRSYEQDLIEDEIHD